MVWADAICVLSALRAAACISEKLVGNGWIMSRRTSNGERRLLKPLARLGPERVGADESLTVAE